MDQKLARMLDASANRASEGLRVMEDLARFVLDDAALSAELKSLRHDLAQITRDLDPGLIGLLGRDTPGDVGRSISTDAERTRTAAASVARAAARRAQEALRSIEEIAKLTSADAASPESLRYALYDAEARLLRALPSHAPQRTLCVLITESLCELPWRRVAELAIEGGARCLQLREKDLPDAELLRRARTLVGICADRCDAIINDRPDVAALAGADGVHVGQDDLPIAEARAIVGPGRHVGVSTTNLDQARAAAEAGASLCGVGPMFESTTKRKDSIAGPAFLRAYLADPRT
ncbi:MAG: thiamine phosphate synthase, partial [Planctomycetota bacterium]